MKMKMLLTWLSCLVGIAAVTTPKADETAVVKSNKANVRGQPALVGEVITQLQKGEKVVVLEEITLSKPKTNEPAHWARIAMPTNTPVWVYAPFLNLTNKTVKVPRLNLRAGPGENYSVVGRLQRGASVNEIRRVEDWMEVETPAGAYAFVAADLLSKGGVAEASSSTKVKSTKATTTVAQATPAPVLTPAPASTVTPVQSASSKGTSPAAPVTTTPAAETESSAPQAPKNLTVSEPTQGNEKGVNPPAQGIGDSGKAAEDKAHTDVVAATPVTVVDGAMTTVVRKKVEDEPVKRIVRREGLVRSTVSIQAPTYYELLNPANRKTINYLHADKLEVSLKDYRGRRIIVTGEEAIDPRWPKTPLIEVETLELIP